MQSGNTFSAFINRISIRILAMLLILFSLTALIVSVVNRDSIRKMYEETFTERVLLINALMATVIQSDDVIYFIDLIKAQDDAFKQKQIRFFHDRRDLWELQERGADEDEQRAILERLEAFHREMSAFKNEKYWRIVEELRNLKEVSRSTYLYVMSDTGLENNYGEPLYTFIIDAEDSPEYGDLYADGLGTCDISQGTIKDVYESKRQMDWVSYYQGDYGELYYSYAPIVDRNGDVVAVLGTDLDLNNMNNAIAASVFQFNTIFLAFLIVIVLFIYIYLRRSISEPLTSLTDTARELAGGNVFAPVLESNLSQRDEIGILANAVNDMSVTYQEMISSTEKLFVAANIGRLDVRNDADTFKGDIKNVIEQINDTLDSMTLYLNSIPEIILIVNRDLDTYFRNDQFINYFGDVPASEFISKIFIKPDMPQPPDGQGPEAELKDQVARILEDEDHNTTVWIDDMCFSIILKEIDVSNDAIDNSILIIAHNITDLMYEKENAQAAAKAKSDFLSRMSHEMRTPMNAIIGMTAIAETTDDISKLKYCLSTISASSGHLLGIINDVLDMSKIEAGKFELENVPMNLEKTLMKINNIVIGNMEKKKQKFNIILSKDLHLNYNADDLRLSQVITNLLSNATKFTPEGGIITLSVEKAGETGDTVTLRISVSDTGIGMTGEQISRLFNAFEQADGSVSRRFGGTGLGLIISKSIVEKMGGRVWVESEVGAGSTFTFEINLERASHQDIITYEGTRPEEKAADLSGVHIILAEDVDINREIFLTLLEDTHISVDCAENGLEAVDLFKRDPGKYNLIVMDVQMPEMDGYQATRTIRGLDVPEAKTIPIIAMTANAFKEDIERCLESGMNDHLPKPIDEKSVINKIIHYIGTDN